MIMDGRMTLMKTKIDLTNGVVNRSGTPGMPGRGTHGMRGAGADRREMGIEEETRVTKGPHRLGLYQEVSGHALIAEE